jgi:glycosyltransferase involved in cell wall biosynthesis
MIYICQSKSIQENLIEFFNLSNKAKEKPIIAPFFDPTDCLKSQSWGKQKDKQFIYVGSGHGYKNHQNLIDAWIILGKENIKPTLLLTINSKFEKLVNYINQVTISNDIKIINLGELPHDEILKNYRESSALVFPSKVESLGLPLVEANIIGLPIIAADLDYVWDVCTPDYTFNPDSPKSIARSVKQFLGIQLDPPQEIEHPHKFWLKIFQIGAE